MKPKPIQTELACTSDIPDALATALRCYASEIRMMKSVLRRADRVPANSPDLTTAQVDKEAASVIDTVMAFRVSHAKCRWFVRLFGDERPKAPGALSRKRAMAARLLLDLGKRIGDTEDPSSIHAPLPEQSLFLSASTTNT